LNDVGVGVREDEDEDEAVESTGVLRDFWLFLNLSLSNAAFCKITAVMLATKGHKNKIKSIQV
jgi:hypothetical protein